MNNQNPEEEEKEKGVPKQEPPLQAPNRIYNESDMEYSHDYNQPYSDLGGSP